MSMEILGYFVHKDDLKDVSAYTVMVVIDDKLRNGRLTCYCPIGQHSEIDRGFLKECHSISKETYLRVSSHLYTPEDYLEAETFFGFYDVDQKLPLDTWVNIFRNVEEAQRDQLQEEGMEELIEKGIEQRIEVEVVWLDSSDEWCLCSGTELFEDGYKSEEEAQKRLESLEHLLL